MGIGTKMIEESIKWLDTTKPFITLTNSKKEPIERQLHNKLNN